MAKKQNFLSKYRVLLPIIYKYIHIVYKHKYVCIYDSYQQIGIDMYAQKNGPYAVHIGQRPVNSPISPLFCQARRTCPELGAFRTHHSVLGNLSLMGNALCIYLLCVHWMVVECAPISNFVQPMPKFMPMWASYRAPRNKGNYLKKNLN